MLPNNVWGFFNVFFAIARIYDLDGDFEAKYFDTGWSTNKLKDGHIT